MIAAEDEQETVVDHFEMQKAGPDELIFAQKEVGDCPMLSFGMQPMPWTKLLKTVRKPLFLLLHQ